MVVDKPAGLVTHPAGGHVTGTLVHGLAPAGRRGRRPRRGRASFIASTATPRGCCSSPARRRRIDALQDLIRQRGGRASLPRTRQGRAAIADRPDRRPDRPRPHAPPPPLARYGDAARRGDVVRGRRASSGERALLEVTLETGRTHQIRVHLEAIELPVCGDPVYGIKRRSRARAPVPARSSSSRSRHPFTGERLELSCAASRRSGAARSSRAEATRSASAERRPTVGTIPGFPVPLPGGARARWCQAVRPDSLVPFAPAGFVSPKNRKEPTWQSSP